MKKQDVKEKMEKFLYYLRQEQELRDEAASLNNIAVPERDIQENMRRESELLREIETLHQEKMLPILDEIGAFVARRRDELTGGNSGFSKTGAKKGSPASSAANTLPARAKSSATNSVLPKAGASSSSNSILPKAGASSSSNSVLKSGSSTSNSTLAKSPASSTSNAIPAKKPARP